MGGMNGLEKVASDWFGVVSRKQVVDALKLRSSIAWKVSTGELERVHKLAYRLRGAPATWERRAMEAVHVCGAGSLLSHGTAAWLHGLDGFRQPSIIDVSGSRGGVREFPEVRIHRSRHGAGPSVICRGLPTTTVQRTIVDLAGELEEAPLELALDSAQRKYEKHFVEWLTSYLAELNPQCTPGLATLMKLLEIRGLARTDSPFEVKVLRRLRAEGLVPDAEPLEVYDLAGNYVMRLDFVWRALNVALHVDSYRWHHQRERFDRDARQRSRIAALGWQTAIVTWANFDAGGWIDDLRALLDRQRQFAFS